MKVDESCPKTPYALPSTLVTCEVSTFVQQGPSICAISLEIPLELAQPLNVVLSTQSKITQRMSPCCKRPCEKDHILRQT